MNLPSAPEWILAAHRPDQYADFAGHLRAAGPATTNPPCPEHTKSLAMPSHYSGSLHDVDAGLPVFPDMKETHPQSPINRCQLWPLHRSLQDADLVAKRKNLQLKGSATAKQI